MERKTTYVIGQAERGPFCTPLVFDDLFSVYETLGHPPEESRGLLIGIQTVLQKKPLTYFRVEEEGFSLSDYWQCFPFMEKEKEPFLALSLPGLSDKALIDKAASICEKRSGLLVISEADFYDWLTVK